MERREGKSADGHPGRIGRYGRFEMLALLYF
jgi:hypothetical protein